ncbi:SRPBCC domain-containing protein [Arthrobacter sp. JUb115]|uniref:SRPBCC domain-containing protein n=1 Tax=Arthrobacter sp. JUb115 TaxID=2485108 RepID=UPI00105DADBA|nr:SRPBCC domain-containing protein [Arthrobacter sp. JUb115]TDU23367.1 activator of Hsp90 ATPase-like protein [Arthrobacter sp. JUb115]
MSTSPTGIRTADGALELRREFTQSPSRIWRYLADSQCLALWYGPWHGDPERGAVDVVMLLEDGSPTERVEILRCDPRMHHLQVQLGTGPSAWQLEFAVQSCGEGSSLVFRMPGLDPQLAGSVGPGWDYYLDRLAAVVNGADAASVDFEADYYPALSEHYEELFGH